MRICFIVGEKEGRIYSLSAKLPLDEMINLEGIEGGDKRVSEMGD